MQHLKSELNSVILQPLLSMMNRHFLLVLITLLSASLQAQNVRWADKVIGYSSQYEEKQYSAKQALGKPNVLPAFKDSPCAWSPLLEESRQDEWIHVGFSSPIATRQVAVAESYNPGSVSRVFVYDTRGREILAYKNDMTQPLRENGRMLRIKLDNAVEVRSVKVVLNTWGLPGWNHIDAIGVSDSNEPIEAEINIVKTLKFESQPENLGTGVNSRYDEIMPIISPDGRTLFFDRKDHPDNMGGIINDDIWRAVISGNGRWENAENVGQPLNNNGHNFLAAISPDGNLALLGNVYEKDGSMSSGLSSAKKTASGWAFPTKIIIKNYYNNNKYSEFHMGADGKTIVMTIERNDTRGGKDLYVSFKNPDGTWSPPKNLGDIVNTAATEMSPFLAADGKTLYFSSGGFAGYGSKDMYMTRRRDDSWTNWTEPQNLGSTINSSSWDAYYSVPASGEFAYFSSENNSIGKTDIFRIKLPQEMRPEPVVLVRGRVLDQKTKKPIEAEIVIEDLSTGKEVGQAISSANTGEFTIVLPAGTRYGFLAQNEKYMSEGQNLDLTRITEYEEIERDLLLVPIEAGEMVVLNNIFFKPSRAELSKTSEPELRRAVKFMEDHPNVRVEIRGHTNSSCSEEWCLKLSTMRAKAVWDWLGDHGVNRSRMQYKGYGSKLPVADDNTPEGKIKNRRVEFKIIGV